MAEAAPNKPGYGPDYGIDSPSVIKDWWHRAAWFVGIGLAVWFVNHDQYPAVSAQLFAVLAVLGLASAGIAYYKIQSSRQGKLSLRDQLLGQLALSGGERVLDIGCGSGLMAVGVARRLAKAGKVSTIQAGCSADSPDAVKQNAKAESVSDRVAVESCPAQKLTFRDATFDAAVSFNALHCMADDRERARTLQEMLRVLKPGGQLLVFDTSETGYYAEVLRASGTQDVRLSPWTFLWCLPGRTVSARKQG